jgi:hypothetical protein
MLHQLGSRAIGARDAAAREQLTAALAIRERVGDHKGAELTRHNLAQLDGPPGESNGHGGPRRPRLGPALALLGLAATLGAAVALLAHGDEAKPPRSVRAPVASTPARGHRPTIAVSAPTPGERFKQGTRIPVAYACKAARVARPVVCTGSVPGVGPAPNREPLLLPSGPYDLVVTARDHDGRTNEATVPFVVFGDEGSVTADTTDGEPTGGEPTGVAPPPRRPRQDTTSVIP